LFNVLKKAKYKKRSPPRRQERQEVQKQIQAKTGSVICSNYSSASTGRILIQSFSWRSWRLGG
jgi:hypothetical protein